MDRWKAGNSTPNVEQETDDGGEFSVTNTTEEKKRKGCDPPLTRRPTLMAKMIHRICCVTKSDRMT